MLKKLMEMCGVASLAAEPLPGDGGRAAPQRNYSRDEAKKRRKAYRRRKAAKAARRRNRR